MVFNGLFNIFFQEYIFLIFKIEQYQFIRVFIRRVFWLFL